MGEGLILTPEEVAARRRQPKVNEQIVSDVEEPEILQNTAGTVKIDYEAMGRFSTPASLYFKDFTNEQVVDITLSNQDDLLKNLVLMLNKMKVNEEDFDCRYMTAEDLLETLIAIKIQFEGIDHTHYWLCDCQSEKSDKERVINEAQLNLLELNYKSIEQVEEETKEYLKNIFDQMSDEEFRQYVIKKYKNNPIEDLDSYSREIEVERTKVKDPIFIQSGKDVYGIQYPRIDHVLKAQKYAENAFNSKIKAVSNKRLANVPLAELKEMKDEEIKQLKEQQAKLFIFYSKAMMLNSKNGIALTDQEKYEEYKTNITRSTSNKIDDILNKMQHGLQHEVELLCPLCGESSKRWLQHNIDPRELLPYRTGTKPNSIPSKGNQGVNSGFDIYFSV
jgi:hypothetical protein